MIKVKIVPWKEVYNLKHTSTRWELALDSEFESIIDTREEDIHLNYYSNDIDVPLGTVYYLRAIRIINNGEQTVTSSTILIDAEDTIRSNVILEQELKVDTPSVYVNPEDVKTKDVITVNTSEFRANNDQHAYTSYILEDNLNDVLWCSLYNKTDLTSIDIPNMNQPYFNKSKLTFKVIHGSKLGVESKIGNVSLYFKNVNFELINNLTNVKALQDLTLKFKKLDPNKRLGIQKIEIFYESSDDPIATYTDVTEDNAMINWWVLRYDLTLRMVIHAVDLSENLITLEKMIKVETYKNQIVPNPDLKYQQLLSNYYTSDEANSTDFYIPNNFVSNYVHNGYIPIPKQGTDTKLYGYEVNDEFKLKNMGEIPGIVIENDTTKEGMYIKRINNDLLLISHTETVNGNKQHVMLYYTHIPATGSYELVKKAVIENEEYGLGYTNALVQYDNKYIYYIPYQTDMLKCIDLESLGVSTITEDLPYIKTIKDTEINNPGAKKISPVMLRLSDDRLLIMGGYTPNGTTFDHKTQTFAESIFWENITYIGNSLTGGNLINGDGIIVKKENVERSPDEDQDSIYNDTDFVVVESLEEIYNDVNNDDKMGETIFTTDLDEYEILAGEDLEIVLTNNFTSTDIRQYYIVYDKSVFRLESKELNKITFHCLTHATTGKKKIRLIASKDQIFDPNTFLHYNSFVNKVVMKDIWVNVESKELEETPDDDNKISYNDPNTPASEAEHIYILGKKYGYNSLELELKVYKDPVIRLPIESLNVDFDYIELIKENVVDGTMDVNLVPINKDLFEIQISNITAYNDTRLTLKNKLREAEFITIKFVFIDDLINGIPKKPIITRDDVDYENFSVLSYFDLITYNFDINTDYVDPVFTYNKTDYCDINIGSGLNKFKISLKTKRVFPLFISNLENGIYSNTFIYINSVDAVPKLNIGNPVNFVINSTIKANIVNDLSGYTITEVPTADDIEITAKTEGLSATLLDVEVVGRDYLNITVKDRLGSGSFSLSFKNKADGSTKISTFMFTTYEEESYPDGYNWTFDDYESGTNNETIFLLPGSLNTFDYTNSGNPTELVFKDNTTLFDTQLSTTDMTRPTLVVKQEQDIATEDVSLKFLNAANLEITRLTKRVKIVPMIFYAKNSIVGDTPIDTYNFTVQHNQEKTFFIYPVMPDGYSLTSIKIESLEKYEDIKYYLKNVEENLYELVINTIVDSEDNKEYKFFVNYTYANSNGNTIETITKDNSQVFTITSKYYVEDVYINIPNNRITMYAGDTKKLSIDTNTTAIKLTPGESNLIEVNNEDLTITALKESTASLIVECGRPDQVSKLEMVYIDILKPKDDSSFEQGYVTILPDVIKTFPGSGQELTIKTNAENVTITVENTNIATFDSIKNMVVGKAEGNTRLKVVFSGTNIKGGTKYFDIQVFKAPEGDPDILYYDSFNHVLLPTMIQFQSGYPTSMLYDRSGRVVLSKYENVLLEGQQVTRTRYTTFY